MGKDASDIPATFADGPDTGRLQWEAPKLLFRGATRRVFEGPALSGIQAEAGDLVLADGSRFTLGEPFAGRWAEAIANPPGRLDKLGVKPGMRVAVLDVADPDFLGELAQRTQPMNEFSELDILFWGADSVADMVRIPELIPMLAPRGALWIVSRKGKAATIKDIEVMAGAKAHGLVDNKVCSFSDTHTALRFTRRKA
ncbi:DUF3052 domain-containing protein [Caulobacter sp. NIBR1757]|uniref:DUF3052 domain-containing protein n=1 Tax=Caulobacter sp. NIBR1757 TaxID=3016000 RepID=UPI0022F08C19|nr:DUF3052 domain-containing protein [Caulobacter sp. NIBR1757]WGM38622.1 hypothetical protein AMEJIAPC_01526 [Caulobacter sp. NIBR1757]